MAGSKSKPDLSIIILSYNVKTLLLDCLKSLYANTRGCNYQIIVVDNASSDGSLEAAKKKFPQIEDYQTGSNLGFGGGNNYGVKYAKAPAVLFLNPDTLVEGDVIQKSLDMLNSDPKIGAVTCRVEFPNGQIDYSTHRGVPTAWNSFAYFTGLAKTFPKSKFFASYPATHLDTNTTHEVEVISGVYMMVKKTAGDQVGWWDKDYFWNGEDIEFSYMLGKKGWKIIYYPYPGGKIIHFKGSSSGLWSTSLLSVPKERKLIVAKHAAEAMRIFYKKHGYKENPPIIRDLILYGIWMLELFRIFKIKTGMKYK